MTFEVLGRCWVYITQRALSVLGIICRIIKLSDELM